MEISLNSRVRQHPTFSISEMGDMVVNRDIEKGDNLGFNVFWTGPIRTTSPLARTVGEDPAGACSSAKDMLLRNILLDIRSTGHVSHVLLNSRTHVTLSLSTILTSWNRSTRLRTCNDFSCIHADT
jgi:hypothetical protein